MGNMDRESFKAIIFTEERVYTVYPTSISFETFRPGDPENVFLGGCQIIEHEPPPILNEIGQELG